jgi:dihydroorotate dehydrogenase electron transfer subunit
LGPLGNGFPCHEVSGKVALVGGGIGIPPLFETAKQLAKNGCNVDVFLGYKDELFAFEPFEEVCEKIFIATETGKEGYKGFVTDIFHAQNYNAVFTCGPEIMMMKVKKLCNTQQVPVWLSMENRMACGIGACLVCTCKTKAGMKRCCKDGPVFSGKLL